MSQLFNLFLEHDYFFAQECVILPSDLCLTTTVYRHVWRYRSHHTTRWRGRRAESLYRLLYLIDIHRPWQRNMVHVIQTASIKAPHNVHYVVKDHCFVECPLFRHYTACFNPCPLPSLHLVAKHIVEAHLTRIDTTKDENGLLHDDSWVSVPWLRPHTFEPSDLEPERRREAKLIDVIHCVVAVPATYHEHRVVAHYSGMTESV